MTAQVNLGRLLERIEHLSAISTGPGPGVTRLPFTEQAERANALVGQWMRDAGMSVRRDEVNNLIGRYEGMASDAPVVMIGSHLDSVIEAGKYDGVLGVLAGVEVVQSFFERGLRPQRPIEVVAFCDEEGVRFSTPLLGSKAMAGLLSPETFAAIDDQGVTLGDAMRQYGLDPERFTCAARSPRSLAAYLELHIEQGPILERSNQACGVVTGIAGAARYSFRVDGMPGHAGTVPMSLRQDALTGAAEMLLAIERVARQVEPMVATVGKLSVRPGASNVIPGMVEGILDIRDVNDARREATLQRMVSECDSICRQRGLQCDFRKVTESAAVSCASRLIALIESTLCEYGITQVCLISGAGHDAMAMAHITDIGMIFVRCRGGLSHHPEEEVSPADIETGVQVLRSVVSGLAGLDPQNLPAEADGRRLPMQ